MSASYPTNFSRDGALDARWEWHSPPARWSLDGTTDRLTVWSDADTDFWQRTHYGFRADNGHFLGTTVAGMASIAVRVRTMPVNLYDQAGLMIRYSERCWLKTSIEYHPEGASLLGAVVTNDGYSDWSTQPWNEALDVWLRIDREPGGAIVRWSGDGADWSQLRLAPLREDEGSIHPRMGIYACSPKGAGAVFEFQQLSLGAVNAQ